MPGITLFIARTLLRFQTTAYPYRRLRRQQFRKLSRMRKTGPQIRLRHIDGNLDDMNQYLYPTDMMMHCESQDSTLPSTDDTATRAAFAQCIRESPAALSAFLMETMLSVELHDLDSDRQFDLEALIAMSIRTTISRP
jgi:hypothetical protein